MDNIAIQVKPKRLSRKIVLNDGHFAATITADQRRELLTSDVALPAQRLIMAQQGGELVVGGVNRVGGLLYVDLITPGNVPVIRLTSSYGRFAVECRTKKIMEVRKNGGSGYEHTSDSPSKFKYHSRLAKAAERADAIGDTLKTMWSRFYFQADLHKKAKASVSMPPEVLLYLNDIRNNPGKAADGVMESRVNKYVDEARATYEDAMQTVGNAQDFIQNPVWYVEPYPNVGVAVCQASFAGTSLTEQGNAVVQITKPMVYASSLDALPDDYRIPVMVRLKMLKAHVENTDDSRRKMIYDMIPSQDKFYDDVGVFTYSTAAHSYRTPCAVLFA